MAMAADTVQGFALLELVRKQEDEIARLTALAKRGEAAAAAEQSKAEAAAAEVAALRGEMGRLCADAEQQREFRKAERAEAERLGGELAVLRGRQHAHAADSQGAMRREEQLHAEVVGLQAKLAALQNGIVSRDATIALLERRLGAAPEQEDEEEVRIAAQGQLVAQLTEELHAAKKRLTELELVAERRDVQCTERERLCQEEVRRWKRRAEDADRARDAAEHRALHHADEADGVKGAVVAKEAELQEARRQLEDYVTKDQEWDFRLRTAMLRDEAQEKLRGDEEHELRRRVHSLDSAVKRLEEELRGAVAGAEAARAALRDAEARARAAEDQQGCIEQEARMLADQMQRTARAHEREMGGLRARQKERENEVQALQASNREWLRQFRRQKLELAQKTLEVDWLRSLETSEGALQELGLSQGDAQRARSDFVPPASDRQRQLILRLGCPRPPPGLQPGSNSPSSPLRAPPLPQQPPASAGGHTARTRSPVRRTVSPPGLARHL